MLISLYFISRKLKVVDDLFLGGSSDCCLTNGTSGQSEQSNTTSQYFATRAKRGKTLLSQVTSGFGFVSDWLIEIFVVLIGQSMLHVIFEPI